MNPISFFYRDRFRNNSNIKYLINKKNYSKILFLAITIRLLGFIYILRLNNFIAPDEESFTKALNNHSLHLNENSIFYINLYAKTKSFLLPAELLHYFGLNALFALRLTSLFFGIVNLLLFSFLLAKISRKNEPNYDNSFYIAIISFFFLPSHLYWSLLAIRESVTEFCILSIFLSLLIIKEKINNTK